MTDYEKTQKINKLAKAIKDSGIAKDNEQAAKMAEEMYEKSSKAIKEMKSEEITAQELIDEEYKTNPEYKKKTEIKQDREETKEDIIEKKQGELEEDIEESEKEEE